MGFHIFRPVASFFLTLNVCAVANGLSGFVASVSAGAFYLDYTALLGAIVSEFDVNRIIGYVTVTSRTKTFPSKADTVSVGYGGSLSRVTRVVAWLVRSF